MSLKHHVPQADNECRPKTYSLSIICITENKTSKENIPYPFTNGLSTRLIQHIYSGIILLYVRKKENVALKQIIRKPRYVRSCGNKGEVAFKFFDLQTENIQNRNLKIFQI